MKSGRRRLLWYTPFILGCVLALFVLLVEMRPGRFYFITSFLLFQDSVAHLAFYFLLLTTSLAGLLALLFNRSQTLFFCLLTLLLPCLWVSLTFRLVTGYNFMYTDAVLAWNNLPLAQTALQNYSWQVAAALASAIAIVTLVVWARRKIAWRAAPRTALLFLIAAAAIFFQIKHTTGVVDDFPAAYRVPLTILAAVTDQLPQPVRMPVPVPPVTGGVPHLFLVVDESITATELTLQNPCLDTTPFLYSVRGQLLDFGVASSMTNQSGGSNIALMSGTRLHELPDKTYATLSRTSIFQFAQRAGYTTYYIDAQQGGQVLQNFMSPEDLKYIDHVERPANLQPAAPYHEQDLWVARRLAQLAKSPEKVFAYVVKVGAHWPYARTYPADSAFFTPVLSARSIYKDPERTLNTYHNALRWTVDHFWRQLMTSIAVADSTVIVYTSDHGQNLTQAGLSLTHASVHETSPQEAAVPLWIWDPSRFSGATTRPQKGFSHEHIFPTLLRLQGYAPAWVKEKYGLSLLDTLPPSPPQRFFLAGDVFGRGSYSLVPFK
ncbi:sulfatase-like hydrolase/transferase [Rufibacter soli]